MNAILQSSDYLTSQQKRDDRIAKAYQGLKHDLIDAICQDPSRKVWTPAWRPTEMPAEEVVAEHFAGSGSEADWHELMQILGAGARGESVHLRCAALLSKIGQKFGEWQCGEAVE